MGATNRPDKLDPALLRGGRLSRTINIPPPDGRGRVEFLEAFTRRMPLSGVDLAELADRTAGLSGADIKALCQQAALAAIVRQTGSDGNRSAPPSVTREDFHHALEAQLEKTRAPIQETG